MTVWTPMLATIEITTANRRVRLTEDSTTFNADLTVGIYWLRGDDTSTDLARALRLALNAAGANTYTVAVSLDVDPANPAASVTISRATGTASFAVLWAAAQTTLSGAIFGYSASTANNASAKVGTKSAGAIWLANKPPSMDVRGGVRSVQQMETPSGIVQTTTRGERRDRVGLSFSNVDGRRTLEARNPDDPAATFERFLRSYGDGRRWEAHELELASGTALEAMTTDTRMRIARHVPDASLLESFQPSRLANQPLYSFDVPLRGYVIP